MYSKVIINAILISFLAVIQFAFISGLPGVLSNINLILVVIIFILGLSSFDLALTWAIGMGFMLDVFSFSPFGVFLVSLSISTIIINFLLSNFFTNRSLYSFFALIFFFTLIYEFILNISFYFLKSFSSEAILIFVNQKYLTGLGVQIILNLLAVLIVFYLVNFVSHRLKPAFLLKKTIN